MKRKLLTTAILLGSLMVMGSAQAYPADVRFDTNSQTNVFVSLTATAASPWYCIDSKDNAINVTNQPVQGGFSTDCSYNVTYSSDGNSYQACDSENQPINPTFTVTVTRQADNTLTCALQSDNAKK